MSAIQQAMAGYSGAATDPYWSSVSALLHMNGADSSTTYTDQTGKTWTGSGSLSIATAQSVFGGASLGATTNSSHYVSTPNDSAFDFGSGDFTIECWVRNTSSANNNNAAVICHDSIGGTRGWLMLRNDSGGGKKLGFAAFVGATAYTIYDSVALTQDVWYYYAAVRDGGTLRLYKDGVQVDSTAITGSIGNPSVPICIAQLYGTSGVQSGTWWLGYIDELRVTKGVCRYPSGTTFTVPTAAFPNS